MNIEELLQTPEGRAALRARHTCMLGASSMQCSACDRDVPYPHPTVEELIDHDGRLRSGLRASNHETRPAVSPPGQLVTHCAPACPKCGYDASAAVAAKLSFLIQRDPPSLNRRLVNTLVGGSVYRREKSAWMLEVRAARLKHKVPYAYRDADDRSSWPVVIGKRRVTIERLYTGRQKERDLDNLIGGMKPCVDALVAERILRDDSPAHAEIHYQQRRIDPKKVGLYGAVLIGGKAVDLTDSATGLRFEIEILGE